MIIIIMLNIKKLVLTSDLFLNFVTEVSYIFVEKYKKNIYSQEIYTMRRYMMILTTIIY